MFKRVRKRAKPAAYVISETQTVQIAGSATHIKARSGRMRQAECAKNRIMMCAVMFVFAFLGLSGRLAAVSLGQMTPSVRLASVQLVDVPRPEIIDRNGILLATDLPMIALEVAGRDVWDPNETVLGLSQILPGLDEAALERKLREGRYVEVRRDLTPTERRAIFDLGLPGVKFAARLKRFYPQADLASHIVGHDEPGKGGVMGLEKFANRWRRDGSMRASIDIRVQQILEDELLKTMEKFSAEAAWGAIMDATTGEIIALSSLPDFDPNAPGAAPADSRRNRATYDRYELGSAFKTFTAAAALEEGISSEGMLYDARGGFQVADRVIKDFHGENRILTLSEVVQHSSNIGIARVAGDLGTARQKSYMKKLGMFEALSFELSENRPPQLPAHWGPVETATIAYGHGISVTPLHLLTAFTAVINGGIYYDPTFIAVERQPQGRRVFSPKTSSIMRRILRRVVTDGTASFATAPGYYPIGKTATADKPAIGGYDKNSRIASFVGAIPGYAPRYAILISLDNPQPLKETYGYATAGWTAAPAFSRVAERIAPLLGITIVDEATALAGFVTGVHATVKEANSQMPTAERLP